jgi:hypothetical protein
MQLKVPLTIFVFRASDARCEVTAFDTLSKGCKCLENF